jgi:hypothetical protein
VIRIKLLIVSHFGGEKENPSNKSVKLRIFEISGIPKLSILFILTVILAN